jgi:uncharacterized protein with HEPN domain
MPKRTDTAALTDIIEAINRIQRYVGDSTLVEFLENIETQDAVVRNFEVIGEAVKNLSEALRKAHSDVEWAKIAGMRDRLIHHYFSVDWDVLWDALRENLPPLKEHISEETSEEIVVVKDTAGRVIGFEVLSYLSAREAGGSCSSSRMRTTAHRFIRDLKAGNRLLA